MRRLQEAFIHRKTVPQGLRHSRLAANRPDAPSPEMRPANNLSRVVMTNGHVSDRTSTETRRTVINSGYTISPATIVTPLIRQPLTQSFIRDIGGGRTYGGGTSKEALQRAKRKAKHAKPT